MKYLFFDIECSNCFNGIGKMCEFGYVLTDEKFLIISKGDIVMSPGKGRNNRFHLEERQNRDDIQLGYDYEYYLSQPEFPSFYNRIKSLMEDADTICFAFSMDNDILHLHHSCTRYGLVPFDYSCYDVQKLAAKYMGIKGQMSQEKAFIDIVGPNEYVKMHEHQPDDDAKMEMKIFQAICELEKKSSKELLEENYSFRTYSLDFIKEFEDRKNAKKLKTKAYDLYRANTMFMPELDNEENRGRRYALSGRLKNKPETVQMILDKVKSINGISCDNIKFSDFFIVKDEKDKEFFIRRFEEPYQGEFITFDELMKK